jgi:hypothetical protein
VRPSENKHLYDRITALESKCAALSSALQRCQERDRALSESTTVEVGLDEAGYLNIWLPGAHTLHWAMGLTQHDMALTMKALVEILRARNAADGKPNPIGSPGAPTINDLRALAAASKRPVRRYYENPAFDELSLEDLGL